MVWGSTSEGGREGEVKLKQSKVKVERKEGRRKGEKDVRRKKEEGGRWNQQQQVKLVALQLVGANCSG